MDDETKMREELRQIVTVLSELTGLPSRWSGRVEMVPEAGFKGRKPFSCDILLDSALVHQQARWPTLIHEALHSFSTGYARVDYGRWRGWEEGVVEQLQRLWRSAILERIRQSVAEDTFTPLEAGHLYNGYIAALEGLRVRLGQEDIGFYLTLLRTPMGERFGSVYGQGRALPSASRTHFFQYLSSANAVLKDRF